MWTFIAFKLASKTSLTGLQFVDSCMMLCHHIATTSHPLIDKIFYLFWTPPPFWLDTRGTSDERAIKGAFLTAVGKEAFTLLRTLFYPKTLRDASIADIQETFLRHVRPSRTGEVSHTDLESLGNCARICGKHLNAISRSTCETDW